MTGGTDHPPPEITSGGYGFLINAGTDQPREAYKRFIATNSNVVDGAGET